MTVENYYIKTAKTSTGKRAVVGVTKLPYWPLATDALASLGVETDAAPTWEVDRTATYEGVEYRHVRPTWGHDTLDALQRGFDAVMSQYLSNDGAAKYGLPVDWASYVELTAPRQASGEALQRRHRYVSALVSWAETKVKEGKLGPAWPSQLKGSTARATLAVMAIDALRGVHRILTSDGAREALGAGDYATEYGRHVSAVEAAITAAEGAQGDDDLIAL